MYESTPDVTCLRQGDVIRNFCFPRYSLADVRLLHSVAADGTLAFDNHAILKSEHRFAVVLSQCCEFNEGKRNAFSLGLLLRLQEAVRPRLKVCGINLAQLVPLLRSPLRKQPVEAIRRANELDLRSGQTEAVNVYLLEEDGEHLTEPHVVDFSQVISVRMKDKDRILSQKVLELTNENRRSFQKKLAYFYGRPAT